MYAAAVLLSPLSVFDQGETRLDGVCSLSVSDCDRRGRALFSTPISMDAALGGGGETVATGWNFNLKLGIG